MASIARTVTTATACDDSTGTHAEEEVRDDSTETYDSGPTDYVSYDSGGGGASESPVDSFHESDLFWGQQASQRLQEQAFDFSLQRWYEEPRKCPKFPPPPVTDLQNLDLGAPQLVQSRLSGCWPKPAKRPPFSTGVLVEVPKAAAVGTAAENAPPIPESEIFDRNFNHQYAYNQATLDDSERCTAAEVREEFGSDTRRIYQAAFGEPPTIAGADESWNEGSRGELVMKRGSAIAAAANPAGELRRAQPPTAVGTYYPPSNLPKLGMQFGGSTQTTTKQLDAQLRKCEGQLRERRADVENEWLPESWTLEDGGWETRPMVDPE